MFAVPVEVQPAPPVAPGGVSVWEDSGSADAGRSCSIWRRTACGAALAAMGGWLALFVLSVCNVPLSPEVMEWLAGGPLLVLLCVGAYGMRIASTEGYNLHSGSGDVVLSGALSTVFIAGAVLLILTFYGWDALFLRIGIALMFATSGLMFWRLQRVVGELPNSTLVPLFCGKMLAMALNCFLLFLAIICTMFSFIGYHRRPGMGFPSLLRVMFCLAFVVILARKLWEFIEETTEDAQPSMLLNLFVTLACAAASYFYILWGLDRYEQSHPAPADAAMEAPAQTGSGSRETGRIP